MQGKPDKTDKNNQSVISNKSQLRKKKYTTGLNQKQNRIRTNTEFLDEKTLKTEKSDRNKILKQTILNNLEQTNVNNEQTFDEHGQLANQNDFFKKGLLGIFQSNAQSKNQMEKDKKQEQILIKKQEIKQNLRLAKLYEALNKLTEDEKFNKAVRHFYDAFRYKSIRHDIETQKRKLVWILYVISNSSLWGAWIMLNNWVYIVVTFFEPHSRFDEFDQDSYKSLVVLIGEGFCISQIFIDLLMKIYHMCYDDSHDFKEKFLKNFKFQMTFWFVIISLADYIYLLFFFPGKSYRFGRLIRWMGIILYSRSMRKVVQGILFSLRNFMTFIIFFSFFITFWAFCGVKIIGNLDGKIPYTDQLNNFNEVLPTITILYSLVTIDLYPESMITALNSSYMYLFYFIPYLLLTMMLLIPIPVAVVFEAFKKNQINLIIEDRLKQRSALFCCFVTLDFKDDRYMSEKMFKKLMKEVYRGQLDEDSINDLYLQIDENNSQKISIDEFFLLIDIIEDNHKFAPSQRIIIPFCIHIKTFVNKKLQFRRILNSVPFALIIFLITTIDVVLIFIGMFTSDEKLADTIDTVDIIFLIIYSLEACAKILSLGLYTYFNDSWNTFDFSLIVISLFFQVFIFETLPIGLIRTASRITRYRKIFRVAKAIRSIKFINFFFLGFEIFSEVKEMISKITLTLPIFFRLLSVIVSLIFLFSSIGIEIFTSKNDFVRDDLSPFKKMQCDTEDLYDIGYFNWGACEYASLETFWGNYLLLVQVMTGSGWSYLIYEAALRLDSLFLSFLYFDIFHLICQLVVSSLFKGIIWEIFSVVDNTFHDQDYEDEEEEEEEDDDPHAKKMQKPLFLNETNNKFTVSDMTDVMSRGKKQQNVNNQSNQLLLNELNLEGKSMQNDQFQQQNQFITQLNDISQTNNVITEDNLVTKEDEKQYRESQLLAEKMPKLDLNTSQNKQQEEIQSQKLQNNTKNPLRSRFDTLQSFDFSKISIVVEDQSMMQSTPKNNNNFKFGNSFTLNNSLQSQISLKISKNSQNQDLKKKRSRFVAYQNPSQQSGIFQEQKQNEVIEEQDIQMFTMGEHLFDQLDFHKVFSISQQNQYYPQTPFRKSQQTIDLESSFGSKPPIQVSNQNRNNQLIETHFAPSKKYFKESVSNSPNNNNKSKFQKQISERIKEPQNFQDAMIEKYRSNGNSPSVLQLKKSSSAKLGKRSKTGSPSNANFQLSQIQTNKNVVQYENIGFKEVDMTVLNQTVITQRDRNQSQINKSKDITQIDLSNIHLNNQVPQVPNINQSQYENLQQLPLPAAKNSSSLASPMDKFRAVVSRVKSELINIEVYFYREKFVTYKEYSGFLIERKKNGEFKEFDEEEHVFQSDDEECVGVYIRSIYDDLVNPEFIGVKTKQKKSIAQDLYNQRSLMNKAMLGGTDKKMMKQLEQNYFSKMYGNIYKDMRETEVLPMINASSKLTSYLNSVLKFSTVPLKHFFEILYAIERKISHTLLSSGSFCKFIYQTVNNIWFSLTFKNGKIKFIRLRQGFWKYNDTLFSQNQDNIIIGKKILEGYSQHLNFEMETFIQELKQLSHSVKKDSTNIRAKDKFYDIILCNLRNTNPDKIMKKLEEIDYKTINNQEDLYSPKSIPNPQVESSASLQSELIKNSVIQNVQFFVLHNKNLNRRKKREEPKKGKRSVRINQEARRFIHDFERQKTEVQSGFLDKDASNDYHNDLINNSNEIMTFAYVTEMVKDIKKIMNNNRDNFTLKASELFFERYKMEISNFLDVNYQDVIKEQKQSNVNIKSEFNLQNLQSNQNITNNENISCVIDNEKIKSYVTVLETRDQIKRNKRLVSYRKQLQKEEEEDKGENVQIKGFHSSTNVFGTSKKNQKK